MVCDRWPVGQWQLPASDFTELGASMKAVARILFALHLAFDEVNPYNVVPLWSCLVTVLTFMSLHLTSDMVMWHQSAGNPAVIQSALFICQVGV